MFGGSVCASADLLPPAGEGWLSLAAVRDGNALPLGKPLGPGKSGIHPAQLFAAAGPVVMWLLQRADEGIGPYGTQQATGYFVGADALIRPLYQFPRGAASGSEKRSWSNAFLHPDEVGTIRHGDGSIDLAEGPSVPVGRAKSEQAPIRRPPSRAEGHCTGARLSAFFSSTGRGAFSFWARPKREWGGGASCMDNAPLVGASLPRLSGKKRDISA